MKTFDYNKTDYSEFDNKCIKLIDQVKMNIGKMDLISSTQPKLLNSQKIIAAVDEVYFSSKIEGIILDYKKVSKMVNEVENKKHSIEPNQTGIITDFEKQAEGYAKIYLTICKRQEFFKVDTTSILAMFYSLFNIPTTYKKSVYRKDDYQNVLNNNKLEKIRVSPVPAFETPLYLGSAVNSLQDSFNNPKVSRLLNISKFFVDFMCIMPFDAGCGRICRLFLQLLLMKSGIDITKYISINKIFENNASKYYESIALCCKKWESNRNSYNSFAVYLLESINSAYDQLLKKTNFSTNKKLNKSEKIYEFIKNSNHPVSKKEIKQSNPEISISTIENALNKYKQLNKIKQISGGRSSKYILVE